MKVVITAAAKADLRAIRNYIATENPVRAASFTDELLDHCLRLSEMPLRYPLVPRYERWGIRRCVHGEYLIFYRVADQTVQVIHILQGAQDYESILFS
jgi:toxin ParE1/3/4